MRGGYTRGMPTELLELIADLEDSIVDTLRRIDETELALLTVALLDLEQRVEAIGDVIDLVAEAEPSPSPTAS